MPTTTTQLRLGTLVATRGVSDRMASSETFAAHVQRSVSRYRRGDWGDTSRLDAKLNDRAAETGERILATYRLDGDPDSTVWIITEWDRSATTILFPSEY